MAGKFNSFVILAAMRTGSNLLEAHLNAYPGLHCYGEAFNPAFIGHSKTTEMLGVTLEQRKKDPASLLRAMREQEGQISGFRLFQDHEPRVMDKVLRDKRCAKIVLTRNPLESYVSWKIATQTGQWKLTDMKHQKTAQAQFNAPEFETYLEQSQQFQLMLQNRLQTSGQAAFYINYEDISDVDVLNGLAAYLGVEEELKNLPKTLKKQNPAPISKKVANFDEMSAALARLDRFDLTRTPNFEPRRGPNVPSYVAAAQAPLMFMPIKGGPVAQIEAWLAAVDGGADDALTRGFNQKTLRQWKRQHPGHRGFTVVSHPVARAWRSYCTYIIGEGPDAFEGLRETLSTGYGLPLPSLNGDPAALRDGFLAFLKFLKGNLAGQTSVRIDPAWASQDNVVQGFAQFATPDMILRAEELDAGLVAVTAQAGLAECPDLPTVPDVPPLETVYDAEIEAAAKDAYQRDYMVFGYRAWA